MRHRSQPPAGCGLPPLVQSEAGSPAAQLPLPPPPRGALAAAPRRGTCPPPAQRSAARRRIGSRAGAGDSAGEPSPRPTGRDHRPQQPIRKQRVLDWQQQAGAEPGAGRWLGEGSADWRGGQEGAGGDGSDTRPGQWLSSEGGRKAELPVPSLPPAWGPRGEVEASWGCEGWDGLGSGFKETPKLTPAVERSEASDTLRDVAACLSVSWWSCGAPGCEGAQCGLKMSSRDCHFSAFDPCASPSCLWEFFSVFLWPQRTGTSCTAVQLVAVLVFWGGAVGGWAGTAVSRVGDGLEGSAEGEVRGAHRLPERRWRSTQTRFVYVCFNTSAFCGDGVNTTQLRSMLCCYIRASFYLKFVYYLWML